MCAWLEYKKQTATVVATIKNKFSVLERTRECLWKRYTKVFQSCPPSSTVAEWSFSSTGLFITKLRSSPGDTTADFVLSAILFAKKKFLSYTQGVFFWSQDHSKNIREEAFSVIIRFYRILAEVPGIARVIIRLAAIPPTSRLDPCWTCTWHSTHALCSTWSWSCLDLKLTDLTHFTGSRALCAI